MIIRCQKCNYQWNYLGKCLHFATCPSCYKKTKIFEVKISEAENIDMNEYRQAFVEIRKLRQDIEKQKIFYDEQSRLLNKSRDEVNALTAEIEALTAKNGN